jgi:RNA-directed DNA polymerase
MKESYIEGVAIHDDPESYAVSRKAAREVLTGAHTGSVSSREIRSIRAPTSLSEVEGETSQRRYRKSLGGSARSQTRYMCGTFLRENREIP